MLALFLLSFVVFVRWILKKIFGFNIHNLSCIRVAFISLLSGVLIVGLGYQLRTSDQKRIDEQNESKVALESKKKTKAKSESKAASESKKSARAKSESKAASESKKRARAKSKSEVSSAKKKKKQHSDTYQNIETIFNMHTGCKLIPETTFKRAYNE